MSMRKKSRLKKSTSKKLVAATALALDLRPSCTQSQFTRPMLFNPRIMQRLMTFSMDCAHASPRSLAEAVAVVACPS